MKLSPAFTTLLHILWGGIFGLIISGGAAIVQYNSTNGINIPQDAIVFSLAILTGLGSAGISTWGTIQKSPALPEAESEITAAAASEAKTLAQQAHTRLDGVITWLNNHSQYHASLVPPQPLAGPAVSRAVTTQAARAPQPIVMPQVAAAHFGETGTTPAVTPQ